FSKGKNVIIGRNNAGKSNVIRAIDLVLGENSPTYTKSDNLTDGDFHSWKESVGEEIVVRSASELFIWCEIERSAGEALNYDEIYKCYGFSVHSEIIGWQEKRPIKQPVRIPHGDLPTNYRVIFDINEDGSDKEYVNPKLRNQQTFENQFEDKQAFAFA